MGGNQHTGVGRDIVLKFRVNEEEERRILDLARAAEEVLSEYLRRRALEQDGGKQR